MNEPGTNGHHRGVPVKEALADLRLARLSRALDDRQITLQKQSRAYFQIAGAGHEALLLALAHSLHAGHDWFYPYYRDQALMLALGVSARTILLASVGSADDPASGGRQMPSHWSYRELNVVSQTSPTGSQCLPAVGCAEAGDYVVTQHLHIPGVAAHADEVTYVSLGEGACAEGEFWEALLGAARLGLRVLFLVADNGWAISVPASEQYPGTVTELAAGIPGLRRLDVDGTDYFGLRPTLARVVAAMRQDGGPTLVRATVTRPYSHSAADTQAKYRTAEELAEEAASDPIRRLEHELIEGGWLTPEEAETIREEAVAEVSRAAKEALASRRPDPSTVTAHVWAPPRPLEGPGSPAVPDEPPIPMAEGIRRALADAMAADPRIRVFGEDVADARPAVIDQVPGKGGVFGTTAGLQRRFGSARCFNTPLAEAQIVGRAIGQATRGLRPVPEIQFFDYLWPAMHQLRAEAATMRWRSEGRWTCPMVLRVPIGGYLAGGAIWHSQSGESIFTHIPGILVAFPSRTKDAVGLLRSALEAEDPVLFLEHKHLYRQPYAADPYPDASYRVPFGSARVARPGDRLTIVTWGATVQRSIRAADALAAEGLGEVCVLDLRSLSPWDSASVGDALARTGRLLVVHEDTLTSGFGAEVAAWAGEHCFDSLDAPIGRVGATDTFCAYEPTLEAAILPQVEGIRQAARALLAY
jgi:2-oxoisovalerate dehydrogenase E1 component